MAPVLMSHSVSPRVQRRQGGLTAGIAAVERRDGGPEVHPQSSEVRPQVAGVRVAVVELATLDEQVLHDGTEDGRGKRTDDDGDRLRVEIPAEALKLRGEQGHVRMVHLEGGVPTAATCAAYGQMSLFDLVEGVLRVSLPSS